MWGRTPGVVVSLEKVLDGPVNFAGPLFILIAGLDIGNFAWSNDSSCSRQGQSD